MKIDQKSTEFRRYRSKLTKKPIKFGKIGSKSTENNQNQLESFQTENVYKLGHSD